MDNYLGKAMKSFKRRSIYFTISCSIALLCIILCVLFSVIYTDKIVSSTTEKRISTSHAQLNMLVSNTDYMMRNLQQSLTQLSNTRNIFSLSFTKTLNDNMKNLAKTDIALASANNSLVSSAFLYVPAQDLIITSTYSSYSFDTFPLAPFIAAHENGVSDSILVENSGTVSSLFHFNGELIIARDYPLNNDKKLATINYIIDTNEMYRLLNSGLPTDTQLWVYDAYNSPIFYKNTEYPETLSSAVIAELEATEERYMLIDQKHALFRESPVSGWKFIYMVDNSADTLSLGNIVTALIPIILIAIGAAFIISLYISYQLYEPLKRLLRSVEGRAILPGTVPRSKNELDYLNYAFSEMSGRQSKLDNMLHNVSPDIINRFFLDLLSGAQISYTAANEILTSINSPFTPSAAYVGCVISSTSDLSLTEGQRTAFLSQVENSLHIFCNKNDSLSCLLSIDNRTFAVILSFKDDAPILRIKQSLGDLETSVATLSSKLRIMTVFAAGHIYHSILDVGFSYNEAYKNLTRKNHIADSISAESNSDGACSIDFDTRVQQVLSLIGGGNPEGALLLSERIIKEIFELTPDGKEQANLCKVFTNSFVDRISGQSEYVNLLSSSNTLLILNEPASVTDSSQELENRTMGFCRNLIEKLSVITKKQQNRFIVATKSYIEHHYSDCDLSLSSVAEAVGTNQSYLSRLFNATLGVRFTDYLNQYRINCSAKMLTETNKSVKDIAMMVGFSSVQNYVRVFKKYTGKTPGQYRADSK